MKDNSNSINIIDESSVCTEKHVEKVLEEDSELVYECPTQLSQIQQILPKSAEEDGYLGSLYAELEPKKKPKIAKRSLEGTSSFVF